MNENESRLLASFATALGLPLPDTAITGTSTLEARYPVGALASASAAVVGAAVAELLDALGSRRPIVRVDRGLADAWFASALRPLGWRMPSPWDPIAGDYRTADGWIRLHTNAPHHRAAALRVLGVGSGTDGGRDDGVAADEVARAVAGWTGERLESAVVAEGGCAAEVRSPAEWAAHPQGSAVAAEPLVNLGAGGREGTGDGPTLERPRPGAAGRVASPWRPRAGRPLAGLRVLDLTRVLAGPVATRLLAGLGAEVLRIDPPGWEEPALEPEMTLGKRCARLDARDPAGLGRLLDLLEAADVLVHGYRPGALDGLGIGDAVRGATRPGLVDVSLSAYGWTGPWAGRRGFDSLVQMSAGIAAAGPANGRSARPTPLPVQALDHATGHLMAAAALAGLVRRIRSGEGTRARLSLSRTALELERCRTPSSPPRFVPAAADAPGDAAGRTNRVLETPWGAAELLPAALQVAGAPLEWERAPRPLGSDAASWRTLGSDAGR